MAIGDTIREAIERQKAAEEEVKRAAEQVEQEEQERERGQGMAR